MRLGVHLTSPKPTKYHHIIPVITSTLSGALKAGHRGDDIESVCGDGAQSECGHGEFGDEKDLVLRRLHGVAFTFISHEVAVHGQVCEP